MLLALDAALAACSAAVLDGEGRVRARALVRAATGHAALLPPLAAGVLAEAGVTAEGLRAVAVTVGPGGFTGLRVGLATAEGIALGAGLELVAVSTGEALAAALPAALRARRAVLAAIDSKRGRLFVEHFAMGEGPPVALGAPRALALAELPAALAEAHAAGGPPLALAVAGDAAPAAAAALAAAGRDVQLTVARLPDAAAAGLVALARLAGALPPRAAEPLYLEPPEARLPAHPRPPPA